MSKNNKKTDICLVVCLLLSAVLGVGAWMWLHMGNSRAEGANYEPLHQSSKAIPDIPISVVKPGMMPTSNPTDIPTVEPGMPTVTPSKLPTIYPTSTPSKIPTLQPSVEPGMPTVTPSKLPTIYPTTTPSNIPTLQPSVTPSSGPSSLPSAVPSVAPSTQSAWIGNIIVDIARFGGREFSQLDTYQRRAMDWIIGKGYGIVMGASDDMPFEEVVVQLYALACTYYSTYRVPNDVTNVLLDTKEAVRGWKTSRRWMMSGSNGGCDWYGVTCNSQGRVEKIRLPNNGLTGRIPPELALLKDSLLYLDLCQNDIHNVGESGNSFLGEMTNLQYLYLSQTFFENDGIPPELKKLSNLIELDISFTSWFGPLNSNPWSGLFNLEYLAMNGNVFKTALPEELIRLPKLEYFYMVDSFLTGDLEWVSRMPVIRELWIDNNPLSGVQIPDSLSRAFTLASFSAGNCGLTGAIPASLGNLAERMTHLWLNDNGLTSIPGDLSKLANLQTLSLKGNEFNRAGVPSEICFDLGRLQSMEVDASVPCECCTCCGHDNFSVQRIGTRTWKHRNE
ncbi:unnamed protein product [Cylindrotheca closterium]|uniref:Leucine-rich repeat-containing N-terminal plant-type domain-containing protein n=1 Tax=Cylindrotheca closterium TaxID=2856 RepID=A0AAD2FXK5_9STRA|nr:unnamed protein product [Cylindrotheca closterium]